MKTSWRKFHLTLKIGIILLIVGTAPFLVVMTLDAIGLVRAGNLVLGTGPLVGLTFYPAVILIIVGIFQTRKAAKKTAHS